MHETVKIDPLLKDAQDMFIFNCGWYSQLPKTGLFAAADYMRTMAEEAIKVRAMLAGQGKLISYASIYVAVNIAGRIEPIKCVFDFLDDRDGKWVAKPRSEDARAFRDLDRRLRRFLN